MIVAILELTHPCIVTENVDKWILSNVLYADRGTERHRGFVLDTTTIMNFVLCVVIVALAIVAYTSKKSRIAMYIGVAFALFGISHLMNLIGPGSSLTDVLLIIRTLAYLIVIFALYKVWKP
jgi:hypothetical protein